MTDKSYAAKLSPALSLYVGLDLGTSGCRAIAIDSEGHIHAQSSLHYSDEEQHHATQTPADWWYATQTVLKDISDKTQHKHIKSIAVDATSGTVLLCSDIGEPLTPALMYHDTRAIQQAEFLKAYAPKDSIVLSASSGLAKILWLLEHYPQDEAYHIVHQADWIAGLLSQQFDFTDINNALKTGFDSENNHWPLWLTDMLHEKGIEPHALPNVYPPATVIANIHPQVASALNLPLDAEIVTGTTDSTASFIASGASKLGDAVTSLGSSLVLKVISDRPINNTKYGIYSQPYGKHWLVGGASNSGGAVLRYYFNDQQMLALSSQLDPNKPTKLNYYPLLDIGERFPVNDPKMKPQLSPKVDDDVVFFQALLEGIAEIECRGYQLLEKLGAPYPNNIRTTGGGVVNKVWSQIRENKLGVPVTAADHTAAAYGTALLALKNYKH